MPDLKAEISSLGGIYKRYARSLQKLRIYRFGDFLFHIPFRYVDYSLISKIGDLQEGEVVTVRGKVAEIKNNYTRRFRTLQKATVEDNTGRLDVIWFNQPYLVKNIKKGDIISLSGKVERNINKLIFKSPDYEIGEEETVHTGRLVPIYPETRGISSKWLRRQIYLLLKQNDSLPDFLPEKVRKANGLLGLSESIKKIHFPKNIEETIIAKKRLSFDEFFLLQLASLQRKNEWRESLKGISFEIKKHKKKIDELIKHLPFELTDSQKKALDEIFSDLSEGEPMNRLLEGDVGSGKTVVAAVAFYLAYLNGYRSLFMAPTEILAQQHFRTISTLLEPFGLKVELRTSGSKGKGESVNILVGTHAVLHEKIKFDKLGLIVIDEQQRFGVEQRATLRKKGKNPHVLTMTATPIPRTVALTLYGDLDLSILTDMPKGRKKVRTWLVPPIKRNGAYDWIKKQIKETGGQIFIICPFIEESENLTTVKAATKEFDRLRKEIFPDLRLGLLHGKLNHKEKDSVLLDFKNQKFDILVATPVVEVGIDVPNATIMLIEASERFGLSQLHQLRGRVGRGEKESFCLLFTESTAPQTLERLKSMEKIDVGAELAELDLRLRGPGEIYGTAQHGIPLLKVASFSDFGLIQRTKKEAEDIISELSKYSLLSEKVAEINSKEISPD